ncbi:hypothetical protein CBOM_02947 [Ceraceosorus bombacis]|uniref:Efficient mitochondria targeting-associated protein 19 n=1 Tax=Ceraceosorus bombacis TaxID=401625 RepID=A0A0P1BHM9_9BASI|nr:hypothetical protein CBOM_02947 [Ceraceosorus bombacis]
MSIRRPLSKRPLDITWMTFFIVHLAASLLVDSQTLMPANVMPAWQSNLLHSYLKDSSDPLISALTTPAPLGHLFHASTSKPHNYAWFATSMILEFAVQVPVFVLGTIALCRATFTTLQCLVTVLYGPESLSLSRGNTQALLSGYIPFLIVPLALGWDMIRRCRALIERAKRTEAWLKKR